MTNLAAQELQSFARRIESVEDEIKVLNADKSEIYKEARGRGYDVKVLRKVIAARRQDAAEREEQGALFDLYWDAIEGVEYRVVRAHVENIEEFDAETGEIIEPQVAPQPVQTGTDRQAGSAAPDSRVGTSPVESETVAISTPIQPETANEASDEFGHVAIEAADHGTLAGTGNVATADNPGGSNVAAISAHNVAEEGAHNASVTTFTPKPLRPYCQNPGRTCGGMGRKHCFKCEQLRSAAGAA